MGAAQSTSAAVATTTAASPTPSAVSCPGQNSTTHVTPNGDSFLIECGIDHAGDDMYSVQVDSFAQCINACATTNGCVAVALSGVACYLKNGVVPPRYNQVYGARMISSASSTTSPQLTTSTSTSKSTTSSSTSSRPASTTLTTSTRSSTSISASKASSRTTSVSSISTPMTYTKTIITSSLTPTATATPTNNGIYVANSGKRGLAYNNDTLTSFYSELGQNSEVSWEYNWFYSPLNTNETTKDNPALIYIPLLFSDASDLTSVWPQQAQAAIDAGADAVFSFNEPDACYGGSACMSVPEAVSAYKQYIQPFAGKAKLGAPAITASGLYDGYLTQFIGNCTGCTIDFINLHWYANVYAFTYLQSHIETAHKMFPDYPIYVTEVGNDNSGDVTATDAQLQSFMEQIFPWLDAVPYVHRYAWFFDAPGNTVNADGTGLSDLGVIYNNHTAPCPYWSNVNGTCTVAADNYTNPV